MTGPNHDEPAGISFHDELHNVSEKNHTAGVTTAPVVNGIPQGPGLTEAKATAQETADPTDTDDAPAKPAKKAKAKS